MGDSSLYDRSRMVLKLLGLSDRNLRDRFYLAFQEQWGPVQPGNLRNDDQSRLQVLKDKLRGENGANPLLQMTDDEVKGLGEEFVDLCLRAMQDNPYPVA